MVPMHPPDIQVVGIGAGFGGLSAAKEAGKQPLPHHFD
jgi:NADH dehydrogenase FAD-containing subunit